MMKFEDGVGFSKDYSWQDRAVDKLMENLSTFYSSVAGKFERAFVVESSPSGGKTVFALKAARALIQAELITKVFVVVPRETIKDGFVSDCEWVVMETGYRLLGDECIRIDADLPSNYTAALKNFHGATITYHSLDKFLSYAGLLSRAGEKCLFIFDEIHHGRISDDLDDCVGEWGQSIVAVQELANAVICMTGTPVRTDKRLVPFFRYAEVTQEDSNGEVIDALQVQPDYRFTYADALKAGVARKLIFRAQDVTIRFAREVNGEVVPYEGPLSGVDKRSIEKAKSELFLPENRLLDELLRLAKWENELDRTRGDKDAAVLIVVGSTTASGNPLEYVRDRIKSLFGEEAITVESKDDTSRAAIKLFKKSSARWIIAKDMISEGTSIPRLRTILIFRDIKSEVRFQQLVHRITRNRSDVSLQDARVIYFCLPGMRRFAQAIEDEIRLIKIPDPLRCPNCGEIVESLPRHGHPCPFCGYEPPERPRPERFFEVEEVEFSGEERVDQGGDDYSPYDPISRIVITKLPEIIGGRNGINEILRIAHGDSLIEVAGGKKEETVFSVEERFKRHWENGLRACKSLAKIHAKKSGIDFQTAIDEVTGSCKRAAGFGGKKWQAVLREFPDPVGIMEKFSQIARQRLEASVRNQHGDDHGDSGRESPSH